MQLVASIGVILIGLFLVTVEDTTADMRVYGWVLVAVGALGVILRLIISRRRPPEPRPPPR